MTAMLCCLLLLQQPQISTDVLGARIFDLINQQRVEHKLRPLNPDVRLANLARRHSHDMALRYFFDHVNPDGKSPADRGLALGITCHRSIGPDTYIGLAENIFRNNLYDRVIFHNDQPTYEWKSLEAIARSTVEGWMNSPGHRRVILTAEFVNSGIGVSIAPNDQVLITQEFC